MKELKIKRAKRITQTVNKYYPLPFFALIPGVIGWAVSETFLPLMVMIGFVLFVFCLNLLIARGTETIEFSNKQLIVTKKKAVVFERSTLEYQRVEHRSFLKGLKLISEEKEVFIWEYEFETQDWRKVLSALLKSKMIKKKLEIYSSGIPKDKY